MILERAIVTDVNNELMNISMRVDKINKTSYAYNMNVELKKDLPEMKVSTETISAVPY